MRYVVVGIIAFAWVWFTTPTELIHLGDSEFYISAAQYHARSEDMRNRDYACTNTHDCFLYAPNAIYTTWSPLLPWLLARGHEIGLSYDDTGRLVNALALAGVMAMVLWYTRTMPAWVQAGALIALALNEAMNQSVNYLMAEMLFLFFVTALVCALKPRRRSARATVLYAVAAGCIVALAILTRYAGMFLVVVGLLHYLSSRRYAAALVFVAFAGTAPGLWLVRNYVLTHTLMGPRLDSQMPFARGVTEISTQVIEWSMIMGVIYALAYLVYRGILRLDVVHYIKRRNPTRTELQRQADAARIRAAGAAVSTVRRQVDTE